MRSQPLIAAILCAIATSAHAQLVFCSSVQIVGNPQVQTIGGISYLSFDWVRLNSLCSGRIVRSPITISSNTLSFVLANQFGPFNCPMEGSTTNPVTIALGRLAPGTNHLSVETMRGGIGIFPLLEMSFEVPAPQPMLHSIQVDSANVTFKIAGATNVSYVLERGSSLTNFVSGPAASSSLMVSEPLTNATMFYRVRVNDGVPTGSCFGGPPM